MVDEHKVTYSKTDIYKCLLSTGLPRSSMGNLDKWVLTHVKSSSFDERAFKHIGGSERDVVSFTAVLQIYWKKYAFLTKVKWQ